MGVHSVIFKCRVVTPMFMAGADNETPELRPSEFKGMMRFWWRAIKAEDNIEKLKQEIENFKFTLKVMEKFKENRTRYGFTYYEFDVPEIELDN